MQNKWCEWKVCTDCGKRCVINPVDWACRCGGRLVSTGQPIYRKNVSNTN